jgi:hypothetical protein
VFCALLLANVVKGAKIVIWADYVKDEHANLSNTFCVKAPGIIIITLLTAKYLKLTGLKILKIDKL